MACSIEDEQSLLRRKINSSDDDASLEQFRKCYEEERKRLEDSNTSPEELAELDRAYTRLCDMESGGFRPIELSD